MELDSTFHAVVLKLKQLHCPLLANKEDWWIRRLLVEPGHHRLQLLEWIILKFSVDKHQRPQDLNSPGEKVNYLLSTFYSFGLCKKTDRNLIVGIAKRPKQLRFWKLVTYILWEQARLSGTLNIPSESFEAAVSSQCNKTSEALQRIVSTVSLKDLFMKEVTFIPPDIAEDVDGLLSSFGDDGLKRLDIPNLEEFKSQIKEKVLSSSDIRFPDSTTSVSLTDHNFDSLSIEKDNDLCVDLNIALKELLSNCSKFTSMYNCFKPVLKPSDNSFPDIGIKFKDECLKLQELSKFFSDAKMARHANSSIEDMKVECNLTKPDLHLNLPGGILQDYISIMQESLNSM